MKNNISYHPSNTSILPFDISINKRPDFGESCIVEYNNKSIDLNNENLLSLMIYRFNNLDMSKDQFTSNSTFIRSFKHFFDAIENNKIYIRGVEIDFFSDIWDFTVLAKKTQNKATFIYDFRLILKGLDDYYSMLLRIYALHLLTENETYKVNYYQNLFTIRRILLSFQLNNLNNLLFLTIKEIKDYFDDLTILYSTICRKKSTLKQFLIFYSLIFDDIYTKEILEYLTLKDKAKLKAIAEENKVPLLSSDFFNKLESLLLEEFNSEKSSKNSKMFCGLTLLCMQTGLRSSELLSLEKNCLKIHVVDGKELGVISYNSAKRRQRSEVITQTIATPKAIDIIKKLILLDTENVSKYLGYNHNSRRYTPTSVLSLLTRLCLNNYSRLGIVNNPYPEIFSQTMSVVQAFRFRKYLPNELNHSDKISFPSFIQFRVYFASELRIRGVDDRRISLMLGHQSPDMWGYYVRGASEIQEEKKNIEVLLKEVINGDATLLGVKANALESKIKMFIEKSNYNTEIDVDSIIKKINSNVEIRVKRGGFCIHSSKRRTCKYDTNTDEFYCAYGCCPNHCHTYFSFPITYEKFCESIKVIVKNESEGFERQVEKELKKLKYLIYQELIPEMIDLELQLSKNNEDVIIERHPNLEFIIHNLEQIKNNINHWKKIILDEDVKLKGISENE